MPVERCSFSECKKKLLLVDTACKCEKRFCKMHRFSTDHACSFNYREEATIALLKTMSTPVVGQKLEKV